MEIVLQSIKSVVEIPYRDLITLRQIGAKVGVALSPATPISTLDYIIEDLDFVLLMTVNPI